MKEVNLDIVKLQGALSGGYRVLATCGDQCINFETRNENFAHDVYNFADKVLLDPNAQVIEGISENNGEPVIMVDFDDETHILHCDHKADVTFAGYFLSVIIEWTQPYWTQDE